jgi:uncharacterized membrane protein
MNLLYPILAIVVGTIIIYGIKLYILTKNINYFIISIIGGNYALYIVYKMFIMNYNLLIISVCMKILPTVLLTLINFLILQDKVTYYKLIGIFLVISGSLLLT